MGANLIERIFFIAGKPHLRLVSKQLTEIRREKKIEKKYSARQFTEQITPPLHSTKFSPMTEPPDTESLLCRIALWDFLGGVISSLWANPSFHFCLISIGLLFSR